MLVPVTTGKLRECGSICEHRQQIRQADCAAVTNAAFICKSSDDRPQLDEAAFNDWPANNARTR